MRRQKKEVIFFIQSFISTVSYCFVLFSFHVIATLDVVISSRFVTFIFTTFIWTSGHASEGVILIIFNTEIKRRIFHPSKLLNSKSETIMPTVVGAKTSNISFIQSSKSPAGLALVS
ncbi:hypothetical protein WR25_09068 [Diploscapter pachys]|uniref:7TM GPCR serpentine receptor class x (Srx) domain-containing protein n=1 Tax=Diploscapter pachys TaxID=2018661 RepID=A0A2A2JMX4_9BILA|nr:hypothetical protein WR25_09068 [Diploscapter pachys]